MMTALRKFLEKQGLTQAQAAKRLKVTQPRISDLTCGKIIRFSLDALVNMLTAAGLEVDFRIKTAPRRVAWFSTLLRYLVLFLRLNRVPALQPSRHQPAENRPRRSCRPARQYIGGPVHAQIDTADAHHECEQHRQQ